MATFKAVIFKKNKRNDGSWVVQIRFSHKGQSRYISTSMYVTKADLNYKLEIKNRQILDRAEDLIRKYREKLYDLNLELKEVDIDRVIEYITRPDRKEQLSFTEWAEDWIYKATIKSVRNYESALHAYQQFMRRKDIIMDEVNVMNMRKFVKFLSDRPRAMSLYSNCIAKMFADAREYYNDPDNDVILIKHTLDRFKAPRQNVAEKRALSIDEIVAIFNLPHNNIKVKGYMSRHDLALDCFKLSFCLMGMNAVDMLTAPKLVDDTIIYNRAKTKDRRADKAEMHVDIHPYIKPLFEQYRGDDKHAFNFFQRFHTPVNFNHALNLGLKEVGAKVGIADLEFYAARHSMATIALNDVGVDKWVVNEMLNHVDPNLRVTDLYIRRDFRRINVAMGQVIEFIKEKGAIFADCTLEPNQ